ncbi:MAG: universal stress protein [Candidatus Krumholzibacteriota bacterium]
MFPFQKILCPTDFSEPSLCGLKMASEMADKFGSEVVILFVNKPIQHFPSPQVEAADMTFDTSAFERQVSRDAQAKLAEVSESIFPEGVEPRLEVRLGQPSEQILQVADEEKADAIFMATHGRTGLKHVVFGSVAERVVSRAGCPVLTVRSCN